MNMTCDYGSKYNSHFSFLRLEFDVKKSFLYAFKVLRVAGVGHSLQPV